MPPAHFDVAPCECGNQKTQWSEFEKHCWCAICEKDFAPSHAGLFDGPIMAHTAELLGVNFDRFILESEKIEHWDSSKLDWEPTTP